MLVLRGTGQEAVVVIATSQHSAQLLGVQAGTPGVRSKCKSIGIHLLLQLGSQGSLRKLLTGFNVVFFFPCCGFTDGFFRGTAVQFYQHCNFSYKHSSMYFMVGFVVTTRHRNIIDHLQLSNKLDCIHHPFLERPTE